MAEARKVFPMNTFMSYLKGTDKEGQKKGVTDLVGYMLQSEVDEEFAPFAGALAKAWIYEQHPEVIKMSVAELGASGNNVSVAVTMMARLAGYKKTITDQAAKLATVEAELAEKTAILKDAEARMKAAEAKAKTLEASMKDEGEKVIVASETKVTEYIAKVDELLKLIEDVKKHGVVTVASGAGGAAAPASGSGAPVDAGPQPDFGFGGDPMSDSAW